MTNQKKESNKGPALSLPKGAYNPTDNEKEILDFWLDNKFYSPEFKSEKELSTSNIEDRETFTIILPPPNANGNLHLGHMSGYAYQDLMGRYNRMKGKKVLLLPGKDHAGIQTEVVFERVLRERGLSKKEMGREKFYRKAYEFCMKNGANATEQEQKIGLSADFDRELFTLDPRIVDNILKAFIMMQKDGLVYRGKRLVNWSPESQSALADIDTEFKDSSSPFVYFKYAFENPEPKALEIKKKYEGKTIEWKFERNKTKDGESALPFAFGKSNDIEIIGLGYEKNEENVILSGAERQTFSGEVIGIQMRLDKNFRLVVKNPDFKGDITDQLSETFLIEITHYAGAHIILFDEYKEDKYYTNGFIIGTVRPETIFGDTCIAVNPKDERFSDFVGKEYKFKTINGNTITLPIIADNAVEKEVGTGVLKVTPAHAFEDWDIAQNHKAEAMPEKQVINFDGTMNHLADKYAGMLVKKARTQVIEDMKASGMAVYVDENYKNRIRICERNKTPIEPLISYQWFVDTKPLKEKAKKLVEKGYTDILPEGKKKTYIDWMNSPEDWCITRQLWWGYRIPVWYKGQPEEYITETGEVMERIGDKIIESTEDYNDFMKVGVHHPEATIVDITRHGETEWNTEERFIGHHKISLNERGRLQAEEFESNENYDLIISSPLPRALETAEIIAKKYSLELFQDTNLMERDFGEASGKTWDEFIKGYPEFDKKDNTKLYQENIPKAETIKEVEERVKVFISKVQREYPKKKILIVTHTGIIRIIRRILGQQTYEQSRKNKLGHLEIERYSIKPINDSWVQDEDVLDTWFSSGQWPFATLNAREGDFEEFYNTQVMETGWDILLFWVTRMMLLNPYRAEKAEIKEESKQIPFENVYLHGLVLDKDGVKMSKSKGNGIDPFEMMQKYGTDALRFSFVIGNSAGQNYRLYEEKIASYRNFCNKIWNASKFVLMNISDAEDKLTDLKKEELELTKDDQRFIEHLNSIIEETERRMDKFLFGIAAQELYESFWHTFADEYIETIKQRLYTKDREGNPINQSESEQASRLAAQWVIYKALDAYLKLLHPFIPFITERVWMELPKSKEESETIMYSKWPVKL